MTEKQPEQAVLRALKPEDWPEAVYAGKAIIRFPNGVESGNWYSKPCHDGDKTHPLPFTRTTDEAAAELTRLRAALDAAETRAQEATLDAIAAQGQAAEAHDARVKAEAERDNLSDKLVLFGALSDGAHQRARQAEAERDDFERRLNADTNEHLWRFWNEKATKYLQERDAARAKALDALAAEYILTPPLYNGDMQNGRRDAVRGVAVRLDVYEGLDDAIDAAIRAMKEPTK